MAEVVIRCNNCGERLSDPIPDRCPLCGSELAPENLYHERLPTPWQAGLRGVVAVLVLFAATKLIRWWTGW